MITVRDQFVVERAPSEVWSFLERIDDFARCVPTLKSWSADGDVIEGRVAVTLGVVPVESRVRIEITERRVGECIEARGVSYLGQTVTDLRGGKTGAVHPEDAGRMLLHLDLRSDGDGRTRLVYAIGIEAEGRLRKIYESILKLKVPAFQREFIERVAAALAAPAARVAGEHTLCERAERRLSGQDEETAVVRVETPPPAAPGLWARFVRWIKRMFGKKEATT